MAASKSQKNQEPGRAAPAVPCLPSAFLCRKPQERGALRKRKAAYLGYSSSISSA